MDVEHDVSERMRSTPTTHLLYIDISLGSSLSCLARIRNRHSAHRCIWIKNWWME